MNLSDVHSEDDLRAIKLAALRERESMQQGEARALSERFDRVNKALHVLDREIERLADKLTPILAEPLPATPMNGVVSEAPRSELAGFLQHVLDRAEQLTAVVAHVSGRVDL